MAMVFQEAGGGSTCNVTPTAGGVECMYVLMTLLLNAGWTHWASSDGISVSTPFVGTNTPATPNRITNFNSVAATAGSLHNASAWYMLRDPAGKRLLGVMHTSTQNNSRGFRIKYVPPSSTHATQNVFTAGTTTQMPLFVDASDNGSKYLSNTTVSTFDDQFSSSAFRFSCGADNVTGAFFAIRWLQTSGSINSVGVLIMDVLVNDTYPVEDTDPVVWIGQNNGGNVLVGTGNLASVADVPPNGSAATFMRHALPQERWCAVAAMAYVGFSAVSQTILPSQLGINPHSNEEDGAPIFYARGGSSINWPTGWKGGSSLLRWNGTNRSSGQALDMAGTRDRITISDVNLPWNGSIPLV